MRKYFWYTKSLRKRNLPSLEKNPPTLSPGLQVSTWALPAFFMPGDALWAAKMLPEVPNFAIGPIEGEGYCCWRRTPQDFQLIFGGQVSIFSHLWTTPSSLLQSTASNYLLAALFTGQELMTLKQAPSRGGAQTDWIDLSKVLLEAWLLATWRAPNPRLSADQSSDQCAQAPVINSLNPALRNRCSRLLSSTCWPWLVPFKLFAGKVLEGAWEQNPFGWTAIPDSVHPGWL